MREWRGSLLLLLLLQRGVPAAQRGPMWCAARDTTRRKTELTLRSKVGQCQAAVAEAVATFGAIDVLFCCASEGESGTLLFPAVESRADLHEAVVGTVEELGHSDGTKTLIRNQFETNLFGPINVIKAALPAMRERKTGHIIALTGISTSSHSPLRASLMEPY
jgi:NAD(P)-dependent dehydrogenase (short-subunit alcohol dehydrogenase family)